MFTFDCALGSAPSNDMIAACIAAQATVHGSWISGVFTLVAGILALLAGVGAYLAAVRQVRMQEENDRATKIAYKHRMVAVLDSFIARVSSAHVLSVDQKARHLKGDGFDMRTVPITIPSDLKGESWKDYALLGHDIVRSVIVLLDAVDDAERYREEIDGRPCYEESTYMSEVKVEEEADGGAVVYGTFEPMAIAYAATVFDVVKAATDLRKKLD